MKKVVLFSCLVFAAACSPPKPAGKRFYTAEGNVSFMLPDSTLKRGENKLWSPDYRCSGYGEAAELFHNSDTSVMMSVYVKAYPCDSDSLVWLFDAATERKVIMTKNNQQAEIEKMAGDSVARFIESDYTSVIRGRPSFCKTLRIYGRYREFNFWFSGPDNFQVRKGIAEARKSIRINPEFANGRPLKYPRH